MLNAAGPPFLPAPTRTLPRPAARAQIALVLGVCVGWPAFSGIYGLMRRPTGAVFQSSDASLFGTVAAEVVFALVFVLYLRRSGWTMANVADAPRPADLARGLGVWLLMYLAYALNFLLLRAAIPGFGAWAAAPHFGGTLSVPAILLVSLVNPVFEEFLFLGYATNVFRRHGAWIAGAASVVLRLLVHTYQGPIALVGILPLGIVFTAYYLRTHRVWPVIVAHAIQDAVALAHFAG